jgi:replicative DNA helicase
MNHAEKVLYQHLSDVDSLDVLARERFSVEEVREVIPTEAGRYIVAWSLNYYFANGRKVAPTPEAITETWVVEMERADISLGDGTETDSIEWAIEQLRAHHAVWKSQEFVKGFASAIAKAAPTEKVVVVQQAAYDLYQLSQRLISRREESQLAPGVQTALEHYRERADTEQSTDGLTFGLPLVDLHTHGVHGGEISVFAAGSGVGKSWWAVKTLLAEWRAGRQAVLFTLELSMLTCFDRIACMGAGVSYQRWQEGRATEDEVDRVTLLIKNLEDSPIKPLIVLPPSGERSMMAMVRQAQSHDAQSIIIDQLTFVDVVEGSRARQRWESVGEKMHQLHELITGGAYRPSVLLMHQINRDGVQAAQKTGRYEMWHMAEAAEVERTATFVFAVFQSRMDQVMHQARLQILKNRRGALKTWMMLWELEFGAIKADHELVEEDDDD